MLYRLSPVVIFLFVWISSCSFYCWQIASEASLSIKGFNLEYNRSEHSAPIATSLPLSRIASLPSYITHIPKEEEQACLAVIALMQTQIN